MTYADRVERQICTRCSEPACDDCLKCPRHRAEAAERERKRKAKVRAKRRKRGRCAECGRVRSHKYRCGWCARAKKLWAFGVVVVKPMQLEMGL